MTTHTRHRDDSPDAHDLEDLDDLDLDLDRIVREFLASPAADAVGGDTTADEALAHAIVHASDLFLLDALAMTPSNLGFLMTGGLPLLSGDAPQEHLRMADLLAGYVRFVHARTGRRPRATRLALAAVAENRAAYLAAAGSDQTRRAREALAEESRRVDQRPTDRQPGTI
ncbi:MAG: hypothetical protein ABI131_11205 [Nostocoides sp.]